MRNKAVQLNHVFLSPRMPIMFHPDRRTHGQTDTRSDELPLNDQMWGSLTLVPDNNIMPHCCTVAPLHHSTCIPFCHGPSYPNTLCHTVALLHRCTIAHVYHSAMVLATLVIHYATLLHRCTCIPFCHGLSYPNTLCHAVALLHMHTILPQS